MDSNEDKKIKEAIESIIKEMDKLITDMSVPKNVRSAISEAKTKLNSNGEYSVRIAGAIYSIDAISTDINLPPQARTSVWGLLTKLEAIKGSEDESK